MRKTVRRRPRTTVKVNFSWSGSLLDVWYLANKSSPNLIRTGTEVSLGGEPESLATATTCVSVVLRWSRSSRVKSPWSLTLKKFKWCVQVNIKNRKSNRQKIKKANMSVLISKIYSLNSSAPFKNIFLNCNNSFKISIYGSNLFIKFYFIILNHKFQLKNPLKKILELVKMTSVSVTSWKTAQNGRACRLDAPNRLRHVSSSRPAKP